MNTFRQLRRHQHEHTEDDDVTVETRSCVICSLFFYLSAPYLQSPNNVFIKTYFDAGVPRVLYIWGKYSQKWLPFMTFLIFSYLTRFPGWNSLILLLTWSIFFHTVWYLAGGSTPSPATHVTRHWRIAAHPLRFFPTCHHHQWTGPTEDECAGDCWELATGGRSRSVRLYACCDRKPETLCEYANVPKQLLVEEWHFLDCGTR